jgi:hypothetical protein
MRPPICALCSDRFDPQEGGVVRFADYELLPEGIAGHPNGLEWFCGRHFDDAKRVAYLTSKEAIAELWMNSGNSCGG